MDKEQTQKLAGRFDKLKTEKSTVDEIYKRVADYTWPSASAFREKVFPSQYRSRHIFNSVPQHSVDIFASSMVGILANPATKWLSPELLDEQSNRIPEHSRWLEMAGQTLLNYINRPNSRFYDALKTSLIHTAIFGMPCAECRELPDGGFQFVSLNIADIVVAEDPYGRISTVFTEREYTNEQLYMLHKSEGWSLPEDVKEGENKDHKRKVLRAIYPRTKRKKGSELSADLPVACVYIDRKSTRVLKETGYHEMPIAVGRWEQLPGSVYSTSPAIKTFSDNLSLQYFSKLLGLSAEKQYAPSVWIPQHSTNEMPDFSPEAVNFYDASKGGVTFQAGTGDLGVIASYIAELENRIRTAFFVDQLQLVGAPQMTAYEVAQRQDQQFRLMAPSLGRMQGEFMAPLLLRAMNILIRQGKVPAPPLGLQDADYQISFTTPISRAQRIGDAQNILSLVQELGMIAQAFPDVLDVISPDKMAEELMDIRSVTGLMAREKGDVGDVPTVAEIRQQRAQQQQAMTVMGAVEAGANMAKTMAETDAIRR